jgi:hypothetical protein
MPVFNAHIPAFVVLIPVRNENFSFGRGELQLAEGAPRW